MLDFLANYGVYGLFLAAFLASTLLPLSSEVVLAACLLAGLNPLECLVAATLGNFLGGLSTYLLGLLGKLAWAERYLRVPHAKVLRAQTHVQRYGPLWAFFSFVPIVGDVIPLALGVMRAPALLTLTAMLVGKLLRYVLVIYAMMKVPGIL